ncbi:MAG: LysR family transcriptional regulator [Myxococcota bacterium]
MDLPSLDSLQCFLLASRLKNFGKAARLAALTPAAFGQRIKQLELQLGVPLFYRTTRQVALTEAGAQAVPWAEQCVETAKQLVASMRTQTGPAPLQLTLGTRHELGMSWLLPQLERIRQWRPELTVHLYVGSGDDLLARVRALSIDCAITSTRFSDAKLDSELLHREDYVFCGAHTLLERQPLRSLDQATAHTLLDISQELPLFRYLKDNMVEASPRFAELVFLGGTDLIKARVLAGAGVAVLPLYLVRKELKARKLVRLLPKVKPLHDHFRLVFRAQDPRRPLFEGLAKLLRERPLS